jgi:hypothetical protein
MDICGEIVVKKNTDKNKNNYNCNFCNVKCCNIFSLKRHKNNKKCGEKGGELLVDKNKTTKEIYCTLCCIKCRDKFTYNRHTQTNKHKKNIEKTETDYYSNPQCNILSQEIIKFKDEIIKTKEDMLILCVKQNKEFQTFMLGQMKMMQEKQLLEQVTNNNISVNNNSNNKTFNLQFFLNETCKDAMNLSDFVKNIHIELEDLVDTPLGYVKCITNQFMKFYKQLPIEKRPFHCSDEKRKSLHVKENGEWVIDDCEAKIRKAVKSISHKNICKLITWKSLYNDYNNPDSLTNTRYITIIQNCCAGKDDVEVEKNEMKVVYSLIKESVIDKKKYIKQ